jgi:hypothetical protein
MRDATDIYRNAIAMRDRILSGMSNETPVQAWAAVCRECAKANDGRRLELLHKAAHSHADNQFFARLDRVWDYARGQVEYHARPRDQPRRLTPTP